MAAEGKIVIERTIEYDDNVKLKHDKYDYEAYVSKFYIKYIFDKNNFEPSLRSPKEIEINSKRNGVLNRRQASQVEEETRAIGRSFEAANAEILRSIHKRRTIVLLFTREVQERRIDLLPARHRSPVAVLLWINTGLANRYLQPR